MLRIRVICLSFVKIPLNSIGNWDVSQGRKKAAANKYIIPETFIPLQLPARRKVKDVSSLKEDF